jgi:Ni2+-binding GTPase involved in maturation of urease and hydrogenase
MVGIGGGAGGGDRTGTEVISVIGLLDSGKSSLIRALLEAVRLRGHTAGVVVNDRGSVELDAEEITRHHPVMQIGGG